ncbi:MAG: CpaF family protein [Chloroflexota bacterium]
MFANRPAMNNRDVGSEEKNKPRIDAPMVESVDGVPADAYYIRDKIQQKLLAESESDVNISHIPQMEQMIEVFFNQIMDEENLLYTKGDRAALLQWATSDILGYGPLEPLLNDASITEIMVNGHDKVYVERSGRIEETNVKFENDAHVVRIIDRIVSPLGRRVDEASPMVDARLPSGYRVNATIPPLSLDGPILTIRKFAQTPFTANDLAANGTISPQLIAFMSACVEARVNIIISGGTGSGKTTLLNVASAFIPANERVITIEDVSELQMKQEHVVRLEKRPPNVEGRGEISIRQLVINALRMRPDRIIVGEARGGEALDMLQAMNTGHDGSMTTIHSNSPRDTLRRIETMVLMAGFELPLKAIREQVASAVDLIIHVDRMRDGTRRVVKVTEVQGMEGDTIIMQDIFSFEQTGFEQGRIMGDLISTGLRPMFSEKFAAHNIQLPEGTFSKPE